MISRSMTLSPNQLGERRNSAGQAEGSTTVRLLEPAEAEQWNQYVARDHAGGLFHRAEWDRAFAVYGLPVYRLIAVREGAIVGSLPLVHQKSLLFGNRLVSLPWFDAAGLLADDEEAKSALVASAVQLGRLLGVGAVELRQSAASLVPTEGTGEPCPPEGPAVNTDKVLMRLRLEEDPEELWSRFPAKVRNQVRKANKCGLTVEQGGRELLPAFHRVYSRNMRDLGSPPHSRRFFEEVLRQFADETAIYVVRSGQQVVGAGWTMANGRTLEIPWASSLREYSKLCVNHVMYWQILQHACREGFARFHFGRSSRDSGTYRFKKQWGAEPVQLDWYSISPKPDVNGHAVSPQESYGWGRRLWQHVPMWLARRLGPKIIAKVP